MRNCAIKHNLILSYILDLVITRSAENIIQHVRVDRYLSDHGAVMCYLASPKPPITVKEVKYRKIKSIDITAFFRDVAETSFCVDLSPGVESLRPHELDDLADNYNMTLSQLIELHAPLKTKTIVSRPTVPWYNEEIHIAKCLRRKAERKWRKTKQDMDFQLFKKMRNKVTYLLNKAKRTFYTCFVDENSSDQKRLFHASKRLLGYSDTVSFPDYEDKTLLVNDIGRFFAQKISRICDQIDSTDIVAKAVIPEDPLLMIHVYSLSFSLYLMMTFQLLYKNHPRNPVVLIRCQRSLLYNLLNSCYQLLLKW